MPSIEERFANWYQTQVMIGGITLLPEIAEAGYSVTIRPTFPDSPLPTFVCQIRTLDTGKDGTFEVNAQGYGDHPNQAFELCLQGIAEGDRTATTIMGGGRL